ncbi:MAG: hypothetical protein HWN81_14225, partial [Candidatus Lokiarchaeota archaeon]|nr:hypothetical protein [Candidatus Lokiarchaeota archaeon]
MLKSKLKDLLAFIKNKKILITTHDLVDIDGLVSCFTLKYFLIHYLENQEISIYFSEFSKSTKNFIKNFSEKYPKFDLSYENDVKVSKADVLLILDTNNLDQIQIKNNSNTSPLEIPYIFIDHHYLGHKTENT